MHNVNRRTMLQSLGLLSIAGLGGGVAFGVAKYFKGNGNLPVNQPLQPLSNYTNQSTDPAIFKAELAVNEVEFSGFGAKTRMKLYNNTHPLQLIRVKEGTKFDITINNNLKADTTVHWHGLDIPVAADGNPMDPIKPNGTLRVEFTTPKGFYGNFWYHPHTAQITTEQFASGLAGALIIDPADDPLAPLQIPQSVLFITDFKQLDKNGQIPANDALDIMNGRRGDYLLVNGQYMPRLELPHNATHRFVIYNATSGEYLKLSFGTENQMTLIGTDGGYIDKPYQLNEIVLSPAERVEVMVHFNGKAGSDNPLKILPYQRGLMGGAQPRAFQAHIVNVVLNNNTMAKVDLPEKLRHITPLGKESRIHKLQFTENMGGMQMGGKSDGMAGMNHSGMNHGNMQMGGMSDGMAMAGMFQINNQSFDHNRIDFKSTKGAVELWEVSNITDMEHPVHFHGCQFQWLESELNGVVTPAPYLCYKDTINVRPNEIIRLKMVQQYSGMRMVHCHILEHEENGMMATILVS